MIPAGPQQTPCFVSQSGCVVGQSSSSSQCVRRSGVLFVLSGHRADLQKNKKAFVRMT